MNDDAAHDAGADAARAAQRGLAASPPDAADVEAMRACYAALRREVGKVIVGQDDALRLVITSLVCGGHTLMVGVPGLAKTLMVRALAEALGWTFGRIQFTPDLMPSDITGTEILQSDESGRRRDMAFRPGPIFANLLLADEINRTPPKTQAALLQAMQERAVTVSGKTYPLEPPFAVVATQNPIEQEGTYPLPEAQLDRFMFSVHLAYPDRATERSVAARSPRMAIPEMERIASPRQFQRFVESVDQTPVSDHVLDYAVTLVAATRPGDEAAPHVMKTYIGWGAGPRATQHLVTAAKAAALLDGRPAPEARDVRDMAVPVLRHRIVPNYNALGEGLDSGTLLGRMLEEVREPAAV